MELEYFSAAGCFKPPDGTCLPSNSTALELGSTIWLIMYPVRIGLSKEEWETAVGLNIVVPGCYDEF